VPAVQPARHQQERDDGTRSSKLCRTSLEADSLRWDAHLVTDSAPWVERHMRLGCPRKSLTLRFPTAGGPERGLQKNGDIRNQDARVVLPASCLLRPRPPPTQPTHRTSRVTTTAGSRRKHFECGQTSLPWRARYSMALSRLPVDVAVLPRQGAPGVQVELDRPSNIRSRPVRALIYLLSGSCEG
jgi:hypothetical protein